MHFVSILCCECKCICRGTTFALAKLSIPACCVVCVHVASLPGYDAGPAPAQEPGNKAIANVRQDTAWVLSYWTFWTFSSSSYMQTRWSGCGSSPLLVLWHVLSSGWLVQSSGLLLGVWFQSHRTIVRLSTNECLLPLCFSFKSLETWVRNSGPPLQLWSVDS